MKISPRNGTVTRGYGALNRAMTSPNKLFVGTTQAPVPLQAPLQPLKVEPGSGVSVSVTLVVEVLNFAVQVGPQLIPAGELETLPWPVPIRTTVRVNVQKNAGRPP